MQLTNQATLLPSGDTRRRAILAMLGLEYAHLRAGGMAISALLYHEAMLAMLEGDRQAAIAALGEAINEGFHDKFALRSGLAKRALTDDVDFQRQQQRLDTQLLA